MVEFNEEEEGFRSIFENYEIRIYVGEMGYVVTFFEFRDAFLVPCFDVAGYECVNEFKGDGCDYNVNECPQRVLLKNAELNAVNNFVVQESGDILEDLKTIKEKILCIATGMNDYDTDNTIRACSGDVIEILQGKWYLMGKEF